jgi:hypothetical protein
MPEVDPFRSPHSFAKRRRGLSTTEMLVSMGILALLVGVSLSVISTARHSSNQATCASNLRTIGQAFQCYAQTYENTYPAPTSNAQWEELLRPWVARNTFCCPADNELFAALGSSYDWRDTGNPDTTLAGRPIMQVVRNNVSLAYDALPGWHAANKVQVVTAEDAVLLLGNGDFFQELQRSPAKP